MNLHPSTDDHVWEPDFPSGVSYGLLADLQDINWGIFEFTPDEDNENWEPSNPVSDELAALIQSGKRYPPALALARNDINHMFHARRPNQKEFAEAYAASIRSRLSQQQEVPYFMAQVLRGDEIDLTPDEWYWVLCIEEDPLVVSWVSDDYFVYQNPVNDFNLSKDQIARLRYKSLK